MGLGVFLLQKDLSHDWSDNTGITCRGFASPNATTRAFVLTSRRFSPPDDALLAAGLLLHGQRLLVWRGEHPRPALAAQRRREPCTALCQW